METMDGTITGSALAGTRVLIVSKDSLMPGRLSRPMTHAGCSVTAVAATDEALALIRVGYRPGLLVLDERLPEPDRLNLAQWIERVAAPRSVTVVALSADGAAVLAR
jgi:DNA-binding response OmpR family regulator